MRSPSAEPGAPLELWAGVECTVNRVGDAYLDQLELSGHARRITDLDRFAELGIRTLRYPVLWERTAPGPLSDADWSWADERLARLRQLGIKPIVGLVHHGSGPRHTSLLSASFPYGLAGFARALAERYPWVDAYTPVNEPLTTARFSALYGHWYPHRRDALSFARALLAQCRAVVLAMRAIREVNPRARLVQTEDLGKTYATSTLAYQAEFENERRWLSFDLLTGRLQRSDPLWKYLRAVGIDQRELEWFRENPCPPDIVGINHYITSERFLDERLDRYPRVSHGGNGRHRYADVEAVRVVEVGRGGLRELLVDAWSRYGLPIAVTEAHQGCTREEQLRWLHQTWETAAALRHDGVQVTAVTAWSLLGAYDWDSLVVRSAGSYEPGVFDLRSESPRPTALAALARSLASGGSYEHPVLDSPGWWQRPQRLLYEAVRLPTPAVKASVPDARPSARPLLIVGATGTLGRAFDRVSDERGLERRLIGREAMDIADPDSVERVVAELRPWAIVNAAGYVRVDEAEDDVERCFRENAEGPAVLAAACERHGIRLVTFSSDLVFDGATESPYLEPAPVAPLNVYGRSKAEAETRVLEILPSALVIRTSAFFGPWDEHNFVAAVLAALSSGSRFVALGDAVVSPTYVPDLVHASLDLLVDGEHGVWHLANKGAVSWAALARAAARMAGLDETSIEERPLELMRMRARRPRYSALGSSRGVILPHWENGLERLCGSRGRIAA